MVKKTIEKNDEVEQKTETKPTRKPLDLDIDELIIKAQSYYSAKEKNLSQQISTGDRISRPSADTDFITWLDSPWSKLTNIKGLPFGRIIQICGSLDSGKTTTSMVFMGRAQEQGVLVIFIDIEGKFSKNRFEKYFGGVPEEMVVISSKLILESMDLCEKVIISAMEQNPNQKILIVFDSIGGAMAKSEGVDDSLLESSQMAQASKENGKILRQFLRLANRYQDKETGEEKLCLLLINQTYARLGSPGNEQAGGRKVGYYSALIIELQRVKNLLKQKNGEHIKVGIVTKASVRKNHLSEEEFSIADMQWQITAGGIEIYSSEKKKGDELDEE